MEIIMNECSGCGDNIESDSWCEVCALLVPKIVKYSLDTIPDNKKAENLRMRLKNPSSEIKEVWKSLRNINCEGGGWAQEKRITSDQKRIYDYNEEDNTHSTIFLKDNDAIFNEVTNWEYESEKINDRRRLQRGGELPDGSHLSWASGSFFLDGECINVPYRDLREILENHTEDKEFSWKVLLYSVVLATENKITRERAWSLQHARHLARQVEGKHRVKHPINTLDLSRNRRIYQFIKGIFPKDSNNGLGMLINYPGRNPFQEEVWIRDWVRVLSDKSTLCTRKYTVPISLIIDKGRLMIRVRRNDTWRKIRVPRDLKIWSILINWSLSIPGSSNRMNLECLQYYLFCDSERKIISDADINGINFLKGIIENSDGRISLNGKKGLSIEGESGMKYTVIPGKGPHSSRFRVMTDVLSPKDDRDERINRWMFRRNELNANIIGKELCIVEEPHLRKLVIGDAIGSIVLALLNDNKSRKNINTLDGHLSRFERGRLEELTNLVRLTELRRQMEATEHQILRTNDERQLILLGEELMRVRDRITNLQREFDDRHRV
ncbi:MAG: hypothetical protein OR994_02910 [Candidatus Poseidoniales archaeon]|nr:hypothetical protein [Candidatus Poseidoniales archaeon]